MAKNQQKTDTSMFCFEPQKVFVSYVPKKYKVVLLLSTMHEGAEISEVAWNQQLKITTRLKAYVDTFDQMVLIQENEKIASMGVLSDVEYGQY